MQGAAGAGGAYAAYWGSAGDHAVGAYISGVGSDRHRHEHSNGPHVHVNAEKKNANQHRKLKISEILPGCLNFVCRFII